MTDAEKVFDILKKNLGFLDFIELQKLIADHLEEETKYI